MDPNRPLDETGSDQAFAELFGNVPARAAPPAADEALVREAVYGAWKDVAGRRARRRRMTLLALAASVLLGVVVAFDALQGPGVEFNQQLMATVARQFGEIHVNGRTVAGAELNGINGGDSVETTGDAGLALGWHDGGSLRLDASTRVSFEAPNRIYLQHGRVYFDSMAGLTAAGAEAASLEIRTDHGVVKHLGTQYMARVDAGELVVSVREGLVSIGARARATAGQQFTLSATGDLSRTETNGVDGWEWVENSSPAFNLDGQPVHAALEWVSRESGRRIRYTSPEAEALARTKFLHGNFDLPPSRALRVFMLTVDLNARLEGEYIVVGKD